MFDLGVSLDPPRLRGWTSVLADSAIADGAAAQVDEIRALEELVCAAQARQLRLAGVLDASSRDGRGVAEQVALARRESPHRGRQHLSLARIAHELPHVMTAFRRGLVTEWRVSTIARETACLSLEDRLTVDRAIAGDPEAFAGYSDRVVVAEVRKLAARLDPAAVAERRRRAESERRVTARPAPDTMLYLTALLPVAEGVAAYAALTAEAGRARAAGDPRTRGQVMADALVARVTGAQVDAGGRPVVPVSIDLVMTDLALLGGAHDGAAISGHGPVPADLARELVLRGVDAGSRTWLRRLYTSPETGELVAMDSRQRLFPRALATFLRLRDQWCRTPWCNAPIRHADHIVGVAEGGNTSAEFGQGLCECCNYAKQADGWRHRPRPGPDGHGVDITTPTGHRYRSTAPPLVGLRHPAFRQVAEGRWLLIA
ncbi:HNH endonuclease [Nocardioides endophyticus]|uniref:HNH endonuclease n=1 Tax=Nocardioides endophyticus TaxID=1353775 RepID=UPI0031EB34F5